MRKAIAFVVLSLSLAVVGSTVLTTSSADAQDKTKTKAKKDTAVGTVEIYKAKDGFRYRIKDPDDWVTGHEPMTGAQASYLKTLSEEARDPDAFDPELEKAEASKRIDALKQETGR